MALKKKPVSRKKSPRKNKKRASVGHFRRFIRAAGASALVSFSLVSFALNPQWRHGIALGPVLEYVSFERLGFERFNFSLDRFAWLQQPSVSTVAAVDGYVQTAFTRCPQFFPDQPPIIPAGRTLRELCFSSFAMLHSGQTKTPVFVVQRLNRQMLSRTQDIQRTDRFYAERRLPASERAELNDYRGSGYSRGHMAAAGDMHNEEAMAQSFSLANMVPQNQAHNAGAWSRIESDTRKYVMRASGDVYVFTGPVYDAHPETIGEGRVAVPRYLYKVVYDATTGRSWVHWHVHSADTRTGPPISYQEFIRRTGLHLLPSLK